MRTKKARLKPAPQVAEGAVASQELKQPFPRIDLPIRPPFPPMEARASRELPAGPVWLYEPKWDGFRCLIFRDKENVLLQSKSGQPLARYFPEMVDFVRELRPQRFVLDGELVIFTDGQLSFDDLLLRIHPAESRVRRLARDTPAAFLAFDLLVDEAGKSLLDLPLEERRKRLEALLKKAGKHSHIQLSPATSERATAEKWLHQLAASGMDGVVAKRADAAYASGERTGMIKVKRVRTADCVVGGFRWASKGGEVGSLLLGLYDDGGLLHHVGFTSSFSVEDRKQLKPIVRKYEGGKGFTGRAPGGPSRWASERSGEWVPLQSRLVCEVSYDHFSGGRFRHGTKFLRWRPDKAPQQCTLAQIEMKGARTVLGRIA